MPRNIYAFGTSHLDMFAWNLQNKLNIKLVQAYGGSIRGLQNANSTTQLNAQVLKNDNPNTNIFLFQLGQVDFEFGYYYKCYKASNKVDRESYIESTIAIYEKFLQKIKTPKIIMGLFPSVINDIKHIYNVNFTNMPGYSQLEIGISNEPIVPYESLAHIYNDTRAERDAFLNKADFAIRNMAARNNYHFIDTWANFADDDGCLKDIYKRDELDHHIKSNIEYGAYINSILEEIVKRY